MSGLLFSTTFTSRLLTRGWESIAPTLCSICHLPIPRVDVAYALRVGLHTQCEKEEDPARRRLNDFTGRACEAPRKGGPKTNVVENGSPAVPVTPGNGIDGSMATANAAIEAVTRAHQQPRAFL